MSVQDKSHVSKLALENPVCLCFALLEISRKNRRTFEEKYNGRYTVDRFDLCKRLADLLSDQFTADEVFAVRDALIASSLIRKQLLKLICILEHMV